MENFFQNYSFRVQWQISKMALILFSISLPLFSCSQSSSPNRQKQQHKADELVHQQPGTFHYRSEIWQNGERKIIDTTITLGDGPNGFFQFGDSIMGGNNFDFQMPFSGDGFNFSFPEGNNGFFSDSLFSAPFQGGMSEDMMKMFEQQRKMMEDLMKNMPQMPSMPPQPRPRGENEEEIIEL